MRARRRLAIDLSAAALSGALYAASFRCAPFAFVAFAPLLVRLHGAPLRRSALLGLVTGIVACALAFSFLLPAIAHVSRVWPPLAFGAFVALEAGRFVAQALITTTLASRGLPFGAAAILGFVASETAVPAPVAWSFASSVVDVPSVAQLAELGGRVLVAAVPFATSVLAEAIVRARWERRRLPRRLLASFGVGLATVVAFGVARRATLRPASESVRVGLVQVPIAREATPIEEARAFVETSRLVDRAEASGATLIVTGEGALAVPLRASEAEAELRALFGVHRASLLVGAEVIDGRGTHNAVVAFEDGRVVGRHDKAALLPVAERAPAWMASLSGASGRYVPGDPPAPVRVAGHEVAIAVCYEDVVADAVARSTGGGTAQLLVGVGDDGWLDGTDGARLHLAAARLRAIEHRRAFVRVTSSGPSVVVAPSGDVVAGAGEGADALVVDVGLSRSRTLYDVVGEVPAWLATLLALVAALFGRARVARGRPATPGHDDQAHASRSPTWQGFLP